jgi:hypothetical protein
MPTSPRGGAPAGQGNWLDYSARTTAVTVNLATGSATGVVGGVSNIQDVIGSAGNDTLTGNSLGNILIGGAGTNVLTGGSGRNLLIGGKGTSTIVGGAADDILIAGTTTFDNNTNALMSILQEWQRTDKDYAQRIADLRNGGGFNGSNKLILGSTVLDNDGASKLTGGGGLDWFFADLAALEKQPLQPIGWKGHRHKEKPQVGVVTWGSRRDRYLTYRQTKRLALKTTVEETKPVAWRREADRRGPRRSPSPLRSSSTGPPRLGPRAVGFV